MGKYVPVADLSPEKLAAQRARIRNHKTKERLRKKLEQRTAWINNMIQLHQQENEEPLAVEVVQALETELVSMQQEGSSTGSTSSGSPSRPSLNIEDGGDGDQLMREMSDYIVPKSEELPAHDPLDDLLAFGQTLSEHITAIKNEREIWERRLARCNREKAELELIQRKLRDQNEKHRERVNKLIEYIKESTKTEEEMAAVKSELDATSVIKEVGDATPKPTECVIVLRKYPEHNEEDPFLYCCARIQQKTLSTRMSQLRKKYPELKEIVNLPTNHGTPLLDFLLDHHRDHLVRHNLGSMHIGIRQDPPDNEVWTEETLVEKFKQSHLYFNSITPSV
nr:MAG: hypothetical protein [Apis mellifra filamentous-like virus]